MELGILELRVIEVGVVDVIESEGGVKAVAVRALIEARVEGGVIVDGVGIVHVGGSPSAKRRPTRAGSARKSLSATSAKHGSEDEGRDDQDARCKLDGKDQLVTGSDGALSETGGDACMRTGCARG